MLLALWLGIELACWLGIERLKTDERIWLSFPLQTSLLTLRESRAGSHTHVPVSCLSAHVLGEGWTTLTSFPSPAGRGTINSWQTPLRTRTQPIKWKVIWHTLTVGGLGGLVGLGWRKPHRPKREQQSEAARRRKCEGLRLIYATFHPTIKIMDDVIDSVGGRGHDWTLRLGEKRIQLIIIPRRSQEAVCWPRTCGWKSVSTSVRQPQISLRISSTTLPSSVKALNPSPSSCFMRRPASSRRSQQTGGREGGRDKVIDSTLI